MSNAEIVVAGHLCLDMTPTFPAGAVRPLAELLRPGVLINMDRMVISTGGTVSNTGIALRIFGCDVASVAKVGDDAIGSLILRVLEARGNAEGIRVEPGAASSYSVVVAPPGVDRVFLHCTGTNDTFGPEDVDYSLVARARAFHFGYPPLMRRMFADGGLELASILRRARETGVTTSLDLAMPDPGAPSGAADWRLILSRALANVDVFVPSIEEAFYCLHKEDYLARAARHRGEELLGSLGLEEFRTVGAEAIQMGCGVVALKAGARGWYLRTAPEARIRRLGRLAPRDAAAWADRELWCPAYRVEHVASATGSGDSSIAGFLAAMLRSRSLEECLHLANCAGAHNLAGLDSVSGLKSWEEVEADSRRLELVDLPFLRAAGWRWLPDRRVWEAP